MAYNLVCDCTRVLQLPEDVLHYSLGRLPADLCAMPVPVGKIQEAFQAMRTALRNDQKLFRKSASGYEDPPAESSDAPPN